MLFCIKFVQLFDFDSDFVLTFLAEKIISKLEHDIVNRQYLKSYVVIVDIEIADN